MQGSDIRNWLAFTLLSVTACSDEASIKALDWRIRFACDAARSASAAVKLEIRAGGCADAAQLVFSTTLSPQERVSAPDSLAAGKYGFWAEARTGTRVVASGCSELSLPAREAAETVLQNLDGNCQIDADADVLDGSLLPDAGSDAQIEPDATLAGDAARTDASADGGSDAAVDAASCSCDGCQTPCACVASSCFSSRLFITYTGSSGSWRPTSSLTVPNGSIVRLGFEPQLASGQRFVEPPSPVVVLAESRFARAAAELDAFAVLPDGRYLFSTRDDETFDSEAFDDDDLIAFEPLNQGLQRYLDMGSLVAAVSGSDVDVDALHVTDDETVYFSVDAQVKGPSGAVYGPADLLVYGASGVSRLVNGTDNFAGRDLQSISVNPATGRFLMSFSGSGAFGGGSSFTASDLIELEFGPGQAFKAGYRVFLRGVEDFVGADGELSAVHFGD